MISARIRFCSTESGIGIITTVGFGGGGGGKLAEVWLISRRAATVLGPAPSPCRSSTVRSSSLSLSLTFLRYWATLMSSCLNMMDDLMKPTSWATVICICAVATMVTTRNEATMVHLAVLPILSLFLFYFDFDRSSLRNSGRHRLL